MRTVLVGQNIAFIFQFNIPQFAFLEFCDFTDRVAIWSLPRFGRDCVCRRLTSRHIRSTMACHAGLVEHCRSDFVNKSNHVILLEKARRNIELELDRLEDDNSRLEWLVRHLGIYLRRLEGFCTELGKLPRDFLQSSLSCCIQVARKHIEGIMLERGHSDDKWITLIESLDDLPNAQSMTQCISCFESFENPTRTDGLGRQ